MYNSEAEKKERRKQMVESALSDYRNKTNTTNAGVNILRYSNQGLIRVKEFVSPNEFMDWYPRHQGYVILRLAKLGLLVYNDN